MDIYCFHKTRRNKGFSMEFLTHLLAGREEKVKDNAAQINHGNIEVECFYSITLGNAVFLTTYLTCILISSVSRLDGLDNLNIIRRSILSLSRENGSIIVRYLKGRYSVLTLIHRNTDAQIKFLPHHAILFSRFDRKIQRLV